VARPSTVARVHEAVLALVRERGFARLTMEGIAARAEVGKQTLYRSWPSTGAILFDALLARSATPEGRVDLPDTGDLARDLETLLVATVAEMTDPDEERVLRAVTAELQTDETLASQLRSRLLDPQLAAVADRFRRAGVAEPEGATELLYGPVFHRWLLRTGVLDEDWVRAHVRRTLRAVG
jgi:AcrR family transcriptional regulator